MPKFSIIVPVYNVEKYLPRCINSILSQSYKDFEVIIINDGSTDSSPEICDSFAKEDSRVIVVHKKNEGLSSARNTGLSFVSGDFVWFIDSDDCIHQKSLETICKYTSIDADIINIGGTSYEDGDEPNFDIEHWRFDLFSGFADKKTVCSLAKHSCSTRLLTYVWRNIYRTSFLQENELLFEKNLCYAEDSPFNMEAYLKADGIYFAEEFLYAYCSRMNSISKSRDIDFDLKILDHFSLYDRLRDEAYEKYCLYKSDEYYKDAGWHIIKTVYVYALLNRLYKSRQKNSFSLFKTISVSKLITTAFSRFDLNTYKSKSLDWHMFNFIKHKMYLPAFLIYRFFLF